MSVCVCPQVDQNPFHAQDFLEKQGVTFKPIPQTSGVLQSIRDGVSAITNVVQNVLGSKTAPKLTEMPLAERKALLAWEYGEYSEAKRRYHVLQKNDPQNSAFIEKVGDCYLHLNKPKRALFWFKKLQNSTISKVTCYRLMGDKERLTAELRNIGTFAAEDDKIYRDLVRIELDIGDKKYTEAAQKLSQGAFDSQQEWQVSLKVHLALLQDNKKELKELFTEFRELWRYSIFSESAKDMQVILLDFYTLASDRCYRPYLVELFLEELKIFDSGVITKKINEELDQLQKKLQGAEAAAKRMRETTDKQKIKKEMKFVHEVVLGGVNMVPYSGVATRLQFYSELIKHLENSRELAGRIQEANNIVASFSFLRNTTS